MIKRGDKLQAKLGDQIFEALGNQTNSGDVLVKSEWRRYPFYIRADMVNILPAAKAIIKE